MEFGFKRVSTKSAVDVGVDRLTLHCTHPALFADHGGLCTHRRVVACRQSVVCRQSSPCALRS